MLNKNNAFTLIELLVVIAILATLAVAVTLVINPAELIRQGRDSTRLSDLANLNKALSIYHSDQVGESMGSSSTVYVSLPDSNSNCSSYSLPNLPSGWSYECQPESSFTKVDGTGWVPVDFTDMSFQSPLSQLPVDPVNSANSDLYYTYVPGNSWEMTSNMESNEYITEAENDSGSSNAVYEIGTDLDLTPFVAEGKDGVGEAGIVSVGSSPVTVSFSKELYDPVVVAVPRLGSGAYRSGNSTTTQHHVIYDVSGNGFTIEQREAGSGDGVVDTTDISWIAMEKGVYDIGNLTFDVSTVSGDGDYKSVSFNTSFSLTPAVVAGTQTDNNGSAVRTRVRNLNSSSFEFQLEQDSNSNPTLSSNESVGYIAVEQGDNSTYQIESSLTSNQVSDDFDSFSYSLMFSSPPVVVTHLDTEDGGDASYSVSRNITSSAFEVAVEEAGNEDGPHTSEVMGWIAVPEGLID